MFFPAVFGAKLVAWSEELPGRCYNTRLVATPNGTHPLSDMIYLGITCFWSIMALVSCYISRLGSLDFTGPPMESFQRDLSQLHTPISDILRLVRLTSPYSDFSRTFRWSPINIVYHYSFLFFYLLLHPKAEYRVWALAPLAMAQYPLHLYMAIAIRKDNERFLEGDSETDWGFGQIIALVLCTAMCIECIRAVFGKCVLCSQVWLFILTPSRV